MADKIILENFDGEAAGGAEGEEEGKRWRIKRLDYTQAGNSIIVLEQQRSQGPRYLTESKVTLTHTKHLFFKQT